jgi:D-alanine transaminase
MTIAWANWNGQEMPLDEVRVPALDRAFLFGDAIYEVVRVYSGRPWRWQEHLSRLESSLAGIGIAGVDGATVAARALNTLQNSGIAEGLLYLQITRGEARRTHHFPAACMPNVLIYVDEFPDSLRTSRETGVAAITYPDQRWARNELKTTSLMANCLAAQAATEAGCYEAILIDTQNRVTEGSHTSVFGVRDGKVIVSPAAPNILPGITKQQVLSLCQQAEIATQEGKLTVQDLATLQELFLTGTPEEILPVTMVDGRKIADGFPGPVTRKLQETFQRTLALWLQAPVTQ